MALGPKHKEPAAIGASAGANCHPLPEQHIAGMLQQGMTASQVRSAIKMAEIAQQHAGRHHRRQAAAFIEAAGLNPGAVS